MTRPRNYVPSDLAAQFRDWASRCNAGWKAQVLLRAAVDLDGLAHGSLRAFNSGCRCEVCVSRVPHGVSGYSNWGCRCDVCSQAHAAYRSTIGVTSS